MHFVFPYRIARVSYLARSIVLVAIAVLIGLDEKGEPTPGTIVAALLLAIYWSMFVVAPRCRDSGMRPWFALLLFVPGMNFLLGGYLTWKPSWPATDGLDLSPATPGTDGSEGTPSGSKAKSETLRQLEALRDAGELTEQDFLRRKARLGKNE
jgi:hypothetical protein